MALDPTDPPLLALVRRHKRHLWVGNNPPFDFDSVFLPGSTNYRTSAGHHRAYDVVWSFEPDVAMLPPESVTLYLDELVRCLGADGRLVVRYHEHAKFTVVQLKRFLGRHPFLDVEVEHEKVRQADGWVTVFRVRRQHLAEYASADWTLAILTQGKKVANVVAVRGDEKDPKLPAGGVDVVLLVDVYHEFRWPYEMSEKLVAALKPGGRLVFVEFRAEDATVPIKAVHKMSERQVIKELAAFPAVRHTRTVGTLPWQHILVFTKGE